MSGLKFAFISAAQMLFFFFLAQCSSCYLFSMCVFLIHFCHNALFIRCTVCRTLMWLIPICTTKTTICRCWKNYALQRKIPKKQPKRVNLKWEKWTSSAGIVHFIRFIKLICRYIIRHSWNGVVVSRLEFTFTVKWSPIKPKVSSHTILLTISSFSRVFFFNLFFFFVVAVMSWFLTFILFSFHLKILYLWLYNKLFSLYYCL